MMVGSDCSRFFCLKPVDEHRSDARALLGLAGFLLDDRGERDELLRRLERQVRRAPLPDLLQRAPLRLLHALDHLFARGAAGEPVAFRQQRSFARHVLDVAGEDIVVQEPALHDLFRGQALGNGEEVLHHLAFDDRLDDVAHAGVLREEVLAGFQFVARLERKNAAEEDQRCSSITPSRSQQIGDLAACRPRRNVDDLVRVERARRFEPRLAEHEGDAAGDGKQTPAR